MSERIEIPYGYRVTEDRRALEPDEAEQSVLEAILAGLVDDRPLGTIADELNAQGLRTRAGELWSPSDVFDLLPRIVEAGPSIFRTPEWSSRNRRDLRAV